MTVGRLTGQNEGLSFLTEIPLGRLTSYAKPRQFPKGAQISNGTELDEAAWFLLSGNCELRKTLKDGTDEVITTFVPGEAFGTEESNVQRPTPEVEESRTELVEPEAFSVVATSDCVVLCFDRTTLRLLRIEAAEHPKPETSSEADDAGRERAVAGALLSLNGERKHTGSRLVTLCFVSDTLPSREITTEFARSLQAATDEDVALVRFETRSNEKENLDAFWPRHVAGGYSELVLEKPTAEPAARRVLKKLEELRRFPFVIIEAAADIDGAAWLREVLVRSDLGYLFVQSGSQELYRLEQLVREVRARGRNQAAQLKPIACLREGEALDGFDLIACDLGIPFYLYVRSCPSMGSNPASTPRPIFGADIRRLARGDRRRSSR